MDARPSTVTPPPLRLLERARRPSLAVGVLPPAPRAWWLRWLPSRG